MAASFESAQSLASLTVCHDAIQYISIHLHVDPVGVIMSIIVSCFHNPILTAIAQERSDQGVKQNFNSVIPHMGICDVPACWCEVHLQLHRCAAWAGFAMNSDVSKADPLTLSMIGLRSVSRGNRYNIGTHNENFEANHPHTHACLVWNSVGDLAVVHHSASVHM